MRFSSLDTPQRAHWIVLGGIIFSAALLRLVPIDSQSLWTDEGLTVILANWSIGDMLFEPTDPTPFLYYALHKAFLSPDASLAALRSISAIVGILSVGLMYILGRLAYGPVGGLLAAALLAVWADHVDYSQEARAYSLLFFLTILTSIGLVHYANLLRVPHSAERTARFDQGILALAAFGAGNVLSFYTHVAAVFWIALSSLLLLALVVRYRRDRLGDVVVLLAIMAACAIPGILRLVQQVKVGDSFNWLDQRDLTGFVRLLIDTFLPSGLWSSPVALPVSTTAKGMAVIIVIAALGAGLWFGRRRIAVWLPQRPHVLWLILAYLLVPPLMWLFGFIARPILMSRVILYTAPGMILLITGLCLALDGRAAAWAAGAAVSLYAISMLLIGPVREKEDWRAANAYLASAVREGDLIALCPQISYPAIRYHAYAPVPAPIVTPFDGRILKIEEWLGTDPEWDKTYFRELRIPRSAAWVGVRQSGRGKLPFAEVIELKRGQSLWRVEGVCSHEQITALNRMLSLAGLEQRVLRFQESHTSSASVAIWEYRIANPITLEVENVSAR